MNSGDAIANNPTGVIGVATSGIQDVSALLPLLGTEQCEKHVACALERGQLYAAATPMSIFGSLGIVKAGFVVLWASVDFKWFHGPTLLRNAGFTPSGIGALLACRDERNRKLYNAEDKLQRILSKKHIRSVKVDSLSRDILLWNIRLICVTVFLSSFGLLPYVFLITRTLSSRQFHATWLYPIIRIAGSDMVAITIQFIFQLQLLDELYCRLRFMATDRYIKRNRIRIPAFWDSNQRSKRVLRTMSDFRFEGDTRFEQTIKADLGTWSSFSSPSTQRMASNHDDAEKAETPSSLQFTGTSSQSPISPTILLCMCQFFLILGVVLTIVGYVGCFSVVQASPRADSKGPLLWLVFEALLAVARTLLWASNPKWDDAKSPILLEKSVNTEGTDGDGGKPSSYTVDWMLNSVTADDMHAIIVGIDEFESNSFARLQSCVSDANRVKSYLTDSLLVPQDQIVTLFNADATKDRILKELEALLQKPSVEQDAPILIYFATHSFMQATSNGITTYLVPYGAAEKPDPYSNKPSVQAAYIQYSTIQDIIHRIADAKTENIVSGQKTQFMFKALIKSPFQTLIMDTCHAGSLGTQFNEHCRTPSSVPPHDSLPWKLEERAELDKLRITIRGDGALTSQETDVFIQDSSHVVLASTSDLGQAFELPHAGGLFTNSLIDALTDPDNLHKLKNMTHRTLMEETNQRMTEKWEEFRDQVSSDGKNVVSPRILDRLRQKAECTIKYEDQPLFSGLLSRRVTEQNIKPFITVNYSDL
ncbi:hypothetical protein H1R20_g9675, partial [Candolleomyces eurysporus]